MRNILAKLPRLAARDLKLLVKQVFLAPDHRMALRWGRALLARFRGRYPSAMECLEKDLDECLTSLLFPVEHRKCIRTTNLLERTFGETRRRTKVIPRFPGERACLSLLFATLLTAAEQWRGIRMTPQILRALDALRPEEAWEKDQSAA
jgi:transposase-like protein